MKAILSYKVQKNGKVKCVGIVMQYSILKLRFAIHFISITVPIEEMSYKKIVDEIQRISAI